MTVFLWIALVLFLLTALPCVVYFGAYLFTGEAHPRIQAVRFFRWSSLIVLIAFNISIFRHIVLIIIHW